MELSADFFERPAEKVARDLLGKFLIRRQPGAADVAMAIEEVEAYDGLDDMASHARFGLTPRNAPMFGPAGGIYVYRIYGLHWMLNLVTGPENHPAAVLIRGAGGIAGPARLTRALAIDRALDGGRLGRAAGLWVEDRGLKVPRGAVKATPRIGVDYAGAWAAKPWRFLLERRQPARASRRASTT